MPARKRISNETSAPQSLEECERIRIVCHLPANNKAQASAVDQFFSYLRRHRKTLGGYTTSAVRPPLYRGRWWSEDEKRWVPDRIVVCIIDYLPGDDGTEHEVVAKLGARLDRLYREVAPGEKEAQASLWVVGHPVIQYRFSEKDSEANHH